MKRLALGLVLLLAQAAQSATLTGRASGGGTGDLQTFPAPSGSWCITVDDTRLWVYTDLLPLLQQVNADSGLTGTMWELHANVEVNIGVANGINGWHGQDGRNGCGGVESGLVCRMSADEILACQASGLIEVGAHGGDHGSMDPYTSAAGEVKGAFGPADSATAEWEVTSVYRTLTDSLHVPNIFSFCTPNHRLDENTAFLIARLYRNCRAGGIFFTDSTEFPPRATGGVVTGTARGGVLHFNTRYNLDPMQYWFFNYDRIAQKMWGPTYRGNRLWIPHLTFDHAGSSADSVAANLADYKKMLCMLAESGGFGCTVWHDQHLATPGIPPDIDGMPGVEAIVRTAAHYARNGRMNRDGPWLQMMKLDDAMNKRLDITRIDGAINVWPNLRLLPDSSSQIVAGGAFEVPWGYPHKEAVAGDAWADSGWTYIDPFVVIGNAGGGAGTGWHGYNHNDFPTASAADSSKATGIFASVGGGVAFHGLILAGMPVLPSSKCRAFCYAWTTKTNVGASVALTDSLSSDWIDWRIIPLGQNYDPSDTLDTWVQASTIPNDPATGFIEVNSLDPFNSFNVSGFSGPNNGNWSGGYNITKTVGRFHMRDGASTLRTAGYSANTVFYADTTGVNESPISPKRERWRSFVVEFDVPDDCSAVRAVLQPTGWVAASAESLAITCIGATCTKR